MINKINKLFIHKFIGIAITASALGSLVVPVALADCTQSNAVVFSGVVTPNNSPTTAWFEYGPTTALGYVTPSQTFPASSYSSNYSYTLNNLSPNTTYYYRAAASNAGGTSYGSIYSITTCGTSYVTPAPNMVTISASQLSSMLDSMQSLLAELKSQHFESNMPSAVASANTNSQNTAAPADVPNTQPRGLVANIISALGGSAIIVAFLVLVVVGLGVFFLVKFIMK
jgi:hypothetical protein